MLVTRASKRPSPAERNEDRSRVQKSIEKSIDKAQQEEAFQELIKLIGFNGGKVPYGLVNKLVSNCKKMG
jgi:hypothetical protein